jgi:glycosyltransferase involved in cell wall biosynthesis
VTPLISVILPVFNGAAHLAEALDSIAAQSRDDLEVLLVDDGSTDSSPDIARHYCSRYSWIHYLRTENAGVTLARNRGVDASKGRLIAFLDQDDRWTDDALALHLNALEADPELGYTLAHQQCFLEPGTERPDWFRLQQLEEPVPGYLPGTLVVRREVFQALGGFDPRYPISSDADWFSRAKDAGIKMRLLPQVTLYRRIHRANQSMQGQLIHQELFQLLHASIARKRKQS